MFLNRGDGTLGPRADGELNYDPLDIVVADLDHDGRDDLVFPICNSTAQGAEVDVVRSRGDGTFESYLALTTGGGDDDPGTLRGTTAVADLDGDGHPDIVFGYTRGAQFPTVAVWYGRPDGGFDDAMEYQAFPTLNLEVHAPAGVRVQDVDGDGRPDVVVAGPATDPTAWIRSAGGRRLEAPTLREVTGTPWAPAPARLRAGALPDLVMGDGTGVELLRNRGNGAFAPGVAIARGSLDAVADVNGDGIDDVISSTGDSTEIRLADGTGGLGAPAEVIGGSFGGVGDLTGDHDPVLLLQLSGGDLALATGDGTGSFGGLPDVGPAAGLQRPWLVADLDGDGAADLAWVQVSGSYPAGDDTLLVRWCTGAGFGAPSAFDLGVAKEGYVRSDPLDLKAGDFNGDGLRDLVVAKGFEGSELGASRVVLGLGGRAFGPSSPPVLGDDPEVATVADFDGDGFDDIAVTGTAVDESSWFLVLQGQAGGSPSPAAGLGVDASAPSIASADFDGDGRIDVAVGCSNSFSGRPAIVVVPNTTPAQQPTPTLASPVSARATAGQVALLRDLGGSRGGAIAIERRAPGGEWAARAAAQPDGAGRVRAAGGRGPARGGGPCRAACAGAATWRPARPACAGTVAPRLARSRRACTGRGSSPRAARSAGRSCGCTERGGAGAARRRRARR